MVYLLWTALLPPKDKSGNKNSKWLCSGKIKNGADSCKSFAIYEDEIKPILFEVFQDTKADADAMVEEYVKMYTELAQNGKISEKIAQQQKIVDFANRKKNKLLQLVAEDSITSADFKQMTADCNKEIQDPKSQSWNSLRPKVTNSSGKSMKCAKFSHVLKTKHRKV